MDAEPQATLVVAADSRMVRPAAVTISSAWHHTGPLPTVLLGHALAPVDEALLRSAVAARAGHGATTTHLRVTPVPAAWLAGLHQGEVGSVATWARAFLGRVLGSHGRALYLDADVLVRRSLAPLLTTDLRGFVLGAVTDRHLTTVADARWPTTAPPWEEAGIPPATGVFNSGVLLADLARWHAEDVEARLLTLGRAPRPRPWTLGDMGVFNTVLWDRWLPLDGRWNAQGERGHVVHFAGRPKPWEAGADFALPLLAAYHDAAACTGWALPQDRSVRARYALARAASRAGDALVWAEDRFPRR